MKGARKNGQVKKMKLINLEKQKNLLTSEWETVNGDVAVLDNDMTVDWDEVANGCQILEQDDEHAIIIEGDYECYYVVEWEEVE